MPWSEFLGQRVSVLTDINRLVGGDSKATLANAPNADILAKIIERLRERIEKGEKKRDLSCQSRIPQGDPLNEGADTPADEGRLIEDKKAK